MVAKPVAQASAGFPYVAFITFAALDEIYQVCGGTCVSMANVNVSIRRVNNNNNKLCLHDHKYIQYCKSVKRNL